MKKILSLILCLCLAADIGKPLEETAEGTGK